MPKGSQLSQLKSALNNAGFSKNKSIGKKRKYSAAQDSDKEKKAAKLNEIHQKLNPFDVKVTKLKHEVGGRKLKGIRGRPAQSKQAGLEQRKRTLLPEFESKDRSGGIVDRRFGENDPNITSEERMLERFTKERQRASRGSAFNLDDEDDLTHYGQSLSKLDDFDDVELGIEDEDEVNGQIDAEVVSRTHFGGFGGEEEEEVDTEQPPRKKSKVEVMAEVMAKSKEYKFLRQMERDREDNLRQELDQEFDSIRSLLYAPDPSSTGSNSLPLGTRTAEPTQPGKSELPSGSQVDFDQHVRELAFDKRTKPKDRTKTEEELALEAKEALERAERKRTRRMMGENDDDSDEEEGLGRRRRKRGGDDLDDDFDDPESDDIGVGLGAEPVVESEESGGEENDDAADGPSRSVSSQSESENESESEGEGEGETDQSSGDSEVEAGEPTDLVAASQATKAKSKHAKTASQDIPFTFPCPSSHDEFLEIIEDIGAKDVPTVIHRIRALYHPSLGPGNKAKLEGLAAILIDHVIYVTAQPSPDFTLVSALLPHLFALTQSFPIASAQHFVEKLSLMQQNLKRGLSRGPQDLEAKTWPGLSELCLLRVTGLLWSTSDMKHAVISPARLLMGAYLGLGRVRSLPDLASGLFICTLFLQFEELSHRFVPETINFLVNAVLHMSPHRFKDSSSLPGSFPAPDFRSDLCLPLAINPRRARKVLEQQPNIQDILLNKKADEQTKVDLLALAFDLLGRFSDMYKSLPAFIELFDPVLVILDGISAQDLLGTLQKRLVSLKDVVGRLMKHAHQSRKPLFLQGHKPIPIPSYIPKFEATSSSYLRRQDPDHDRREASKLRHEYKQERKGAIRELRKDARFLAGVQQEKQREKDRAYHDSMKKVFGSIEGERAEQKLMEREKMKEKRRSGRK